MNVQIDFSSASQVGFALLGTVYLLLPVSAFLLLRKYRSARLLPVILGALVYLLVTRLNDIAVGILFASSAPAFKVIMASLTVGIFEESGRYLTMKYPLRYCNKTGDALSYAIGHGGMECIIRAVRAFQYFGYAGKFREGGLPAFTANRTNAEAAQITETLRNISEQTFGVSLASCLGAATAFLFHAAMSVLILQAIQSESKRQFILAIGLHILLNGIAYDFSLLGLLAGRILTTLLEVGIVLYVMKKIDGKSLLMEIRDHAFFQHDYS